MSKNILIISGSPKRNGNTAALVEWFSQGARSAGARIEIVSAAFLKYKALGCRSCRKCQEAKAYGCVIHDDASIVVAKMAKADVIVMATPLYFYGPSSQLKLIFDRMFSLYKWDNVRGTMRTCLNKKTLVLLASAFEDVGLDVLAKPFKLTADYSKMKFLSLLVANADVSGEIRNRPGIKQKAMALGRKAAG